MFKVCNLDRLKNKYGANVILCKTPATMSKRRAENLLQDDRGDSEPDSAPTEEAEAGPASCFYEEAPDKSTHRQTAIFVILRSRGVWQEKSHTRWLKTCTNMSGV